MIILHGFTNGSVIMESVMEMLCDKYWCVAIDLRGHGYSSYNTKITSIKDMAIDINLFIKEVLKVNEIYLLGHSSGGVLAMKLSVLMNYNVQKLILLSSSFDDLWKIKNPDTELNSIEQLKEPE